MKIQEMLYGWQARATEEDLNEMRDVLGNILFAIDGYKPLQVLSDDLEDTISSIDTDIEGLRREDRIAEENAKYNEVKDAQ